MLMPFQNYVRAGKVKKASPDKGEAQGLRRSGFDDFKKIQESLPISDDTASLVVKNVYDSVRALLQAFLAAEGWTPYSHEAIIAFNHEKGNITEEETNRLDKFRELRNDISYRAVRATPEEARELIILVRVLFERLGPQIDAL